MSISEEQATEIMAIAKQCNVDDLFGDVYMSHDLMKFAIALIARYAVEPK